MSAEQIMDRIRRDAPSWHVDFNDSSYAITVWADRPDRMLFCGNSGTFESGWTLASEHTGVRGDLYILSVLPDRFNIQKFDRDMVSEGSYFPRQ
jgi:hypothetical protein